MKNFICNICPRNCNALRTEKIGTGFCKSSLTIHIGRYAPHFWEEPCISGTNGSGAIFFTGCNMHCVYCQNSTISIKEVGKAISIEQLADIFKELEDLGVHNINLVTPTHYTLQIIKALEIYKPNIPIVYNCGGYEKIDTIKMLKGYIDIYLPDFKYYSNDIALKYSLAKNYRETAINAIHEMIDQTGRPVFNDDNILIKGTIVRHLILPNNIKDSLNVIDQIEKSFGKNVLISLMHQYYPAGNSNKFPEINRVLKPIEYKRVMYHLFNSSLDGFVQESDSADEKYTPDFYIE